MRLDLVQLALAQRAGDVAADAVAAAVRIRGLPRWFFKYGSILGGLASLRRRSLLFSTFTEGFFNHAERAFGNLKIRQIARGVPIRRAQTSSPATELAAGDPADVVDQHVVVFGRCRSRRA